MKKIFALLVAIVLCFMLIACDSDDASSAAAESASKAAEASTAKGNAASQTVATEATTTTEETTESTTAASAYCKDLTSKYSSFTKMTCSKGSLVDKGDSYEVYVNIDKDGNSIGGETVRISKNATVTWFNGETTTQLSISSYLNQVSSIRMWRNNFEDNQVFATNSDGYIVAFFDGLFS